MIHRLFALHGPLGPKWAEAIVKAAFSDARATDPLRRLSLLTLIENN